MHCPSATKVIDSKYIIDFDRKTIEVFLQCTGSLAFANFTLEKLYFIDSEPKGEVISSKTDRLVAT